MKRLIVVYNPRSSRFIDVQNEVLSKVRQLKGYMIGKYEVAPTDVDDNAKKFSKILKDGDTVISAGGDATASISANGILQSGKDVRLAVLPYGNFNDLARTLGVMKYEDLFNQNGEIANLEDYDKEEADRNRPGRLYPLEIIVDGKFFRYATCYVTIGMTAEAVELFDAPKTRKKLQKGHKSSWRSYLYLMSWYFKHHHKKRFIPNFKLNGVLQSKNISDYAAVSGRSMCRIMKGGYDYRIPKVFRSTTDHLVSFWRLVKLMIKSVTIRTPGTETEGDVLEFLKPATVELQAEGEYRIFKDIKKIEIRKSKKCLKTIER